MRHRRGHALFFTGGLSTVISLILGVIAVVYAGRARRNVAEGRTTKHAEMAGGARIAGWITVGISLIATTVWTLLLVFADPL